MRSRGLLADIRPPPTGDQLSDPCRSSLGGQIHSRQSLLAGEAKNVASREFLKFPVPSGGRLRALFGLTGAEAKLAQRLASGDSVEEVAQELCIKMTTARTQLAAIFGKTATRRQAKLVAVLSRIAHLEISKLENDTAGSVLRGPRTAEAELLLDRSAKCD